MPAVLAMIAVLAVLAGWSPNLLASLASSQEEPKEPAEMSAQRRAGEGIGVGTRATVGETDRGKNGDPWARRAARVDGAVQADVQAVEQAVAALQEAVAKDPEHPGTRARLLRALSFQGEHVVEGAEAQQGHFEAARLLAEEGFERLARRRGGVRSLDDLEPEERAEALRGLLREAGNDRGWTATDLAALHFWGAVVWGQWADRVGSLKAARQGVADELRILAGTALRLDPGYADAGPDRFLGRLHAEAPKIPFFTGWVDRGEAVRHLEAAVRRAPEEPENALFLAEALLEYRPERGQEARKLLRELAARQPRPDHLLGDTRTLERARTALAELE